jgi:2-methylisocitrate lyase-like PEP mutase family enzyme
MYYSKIRAAVEALKGTDCLLIARTNADPNDPGEFEEGCTRMRESMEMGADMAMIVKVGTYAQAKYMAERVPGWKIFADVRADNGIPSATMEQLTPLIQVRIHALHDEGCDGRHAGARARKFQGTKCRLYLHPCVGNRDHEL